MRRPSASYLGGFLPGSPKVRDFARFGAVQCQPARLDRTRQADRALRAGGMPGPTSWSG